MEKRVAIVTGASSGVGKETVRSFIAQGFIVFGVARKAQQQEDLRNIGANLINVDLAQEAEVKVGMQKILSETKRVDVLVNVAGISIDGAIEDITDQQAEQEIQVNALGAMRMVRLVLPIMRHQGFGRIINVSSMTSYAYMPLLGWYGASKRLLEGVTDSLRLEVQPFGIKVALIQPSGIATPMSAPDKTPSFVENSGKKAYSDLVQGLSEIFKKGAKQSIQPQSVAELIVRISNEKHVRARYQIGKGARSSYLATKLMPGWLYDQAITRFIKK